VDPAGDEDIVDGEPPTFDGLLVSIEGEEKAEGDPTTDGGRRDGIVGFPLAPDGVAADGDLDTTTVGVGTGIPPPPPTVGPLPIVDDGRLEATVGPPTLAAGEDELGEAGELTLGPVADGTAPTLGILLASGPGLVTAVGLATVGTVAAVGAVKAPPRLGKLVVNLVGPDVGGVVVLFSDVGAGLDVICLVSGASPCLAKMSDWTSPSDSPPASDLSFLQTCRCKL
jgi:hypothetical protein